MKQGSLQGLRALFQAASTTGRGHGLRGPSFLLVHLGGWVGLSCVSLHRCIPYACSARISHLRSFWAWVTTSGLCSRSITAVSAPTSTSVYRGRTVQTTEPRSFSIEVGALALRAVDPSQSSAILLRLALKGLALSSNIRTMITNTAPICIVFSCW